MGRTAATAHVSSPSNCTIRVCTLNFNQSSIDPVAVTSCTLTDTNAAYTGIVKADITFFQANTRVAAIDVIFEKVCTTASAGTHVIHSYDQISTVLASKVSSTTAAVAAATATAAAAATTTTVATSI